jgi:hypothetical protein
MNMTQTDIDTCANVLGAPQPAGSGAWLWSLRDDTSGRVLAVTVSTGVDLGDGPTTIVSAQTHQGYVELHDVTGYLCIEPDEVMFVARRDDRFSSLVVGKTGTCSQFANIRPSLLRADFAELDPAALMAALQLSLAEEIVS